MKKGLNYLLNKVKSKSAYFLLGTVISDIIALVLYLNTGVSIFIPELSASVIAFMALGIVLPFAVVFSPYKIAYVVPYVVNLFISFNYLASQASYIANVFVGIDGSMFSAAFYLIVACPLVSAVLSLVAMRFVKETFAETADKYFAEEH